MNLKVLSLAGLGVLGAGAAGAIGIAASSGGGEKESEEITTPAPIPTISQKLSDSGYTYNPPKLSDHGKLVQGCTENLLNKDGLDNSKFYGCGVAKLDLWDSRDQFGSQTVDYLKFASEIFIRKKDEGWRINTRIDNYSSNGLIYQHLLTHYKKSGKNLEIEKIFLIEVGNSGRKEPKAVTFPIENKPQEIVWVANTNEKLNIKLPGEAGYWYQGNNYLIVKHPSLPLPPLTKVHKESKEWSGIWIDKPTSNQQWMLQDMEVFISDMKYSQVFCKEDSCGAGSTNMLYKSERLQEGFVAPNAWWEAAQKLLGQDTKTSTDTSEPRKSILNFIKGSKGEWVDADSFCRSGNESGTEISEEDLKQLTIYCSKSKA